MKSIVNSSSLIHHCGSPLTEIWTVPIKSLSKTEDSAELYFEIWGLFEPETPKEYQAEQAYIMSHMPAQPRHDPAFRIREQTREDRAELTDVKQPTSGAPHHLTTGLQWCSSLFWGRENTSTELRVLCRAWIRKIQPVSHLQKQRFSKDPQEKSKHGSKIHCHGFQAHLSNCLDSRLTYLTLLKINKLTHLFNFK